MISRNIDAALDLLSDRAEKDFRLPWLTIQWPVRDDDMLPADWSWTLPDELPIAHADWYQALGLSQKSELSLRMLRACFEDVIDFEVQLIAGLCEYGERWPISAPLMRFIHHEIAEESYHCLMFRKLLDHLPKPLDTSNEAEQRVMQTGVPARKLLDTSPYLFFALVLAGESPIDRLQRVLVKSASTPPLVKAVCSAHVADEGRHLRFVRLVLRDLFGSMSPDEQRHRRIQARFVEQTAQRRVDAKSRVILSDYCNEAGVGSSFDDWVGHSTLLLTD
jgi:hypothetical protein